MNLNLREQLMIVKNWELAKKVKFLNKVSQNVPVGIRIILNRDNLNNYKKIEAIRWINEFQHEINKIVNINENPLSSDEEIVSISNYIKLIVSKCEGDIDSEIAFCFNDAFTNMRV